MSDELPPEPEPKPEPKPESEAKSESASETASEATTEVTPVADPDHAEPGAEPSGRRSTVLIVAVAVAVLVAIGVGVYLVATSGDSTAADDPEQPRITGSTQPEPPSSAPPAEPSEPAPPPAESPVPPPADKKVAAAKTAAEQAATAINNRDIEAMRQLSCDPSTVGSAEEFPPRATVRVAQAPQVAGNRATAQIELSIAGSEPTVVPLPLELRGGTWCVP